MGMITGMVKEVVGTVTGDKLLARDGWKERHGMEVTHRARTVGEKVEEILRHPEFDDPEGDGTELPLVEPAPGERVVGGKRPDGGHWFGLR